MRVFRANLDGSEIEVLVTTGTSEADRLDQHNWCVGVAVDPVRKLMYWTQKGPSKGNGGRLFRAGLDKPNDEESQSRSEIRLLLDYLPEPIDLDLDSTQNALYMTDRGGMPDCLLHLPQAVAMADAPQTLHMAIRLARYR